MNDSITLNLLHIDHGCKAIMYMDSTMNNELGIGHAVATYRDHRTVTKWTVDFKIGQEEFHNVSSTLNSVREYLDGVQEHLRKTSDEPVLICNAQVRPDLITFKNLAGHIVAEVDNIADFIGALQSTYGTNRDLKLLVVGHRDQNIPEVYRPFREIHMRL